MFPTPPSNSDLGNLFRAQREAWQREPYPSWKTRAERLKALRALVRDNSDALADAISADFGQRAKAETKMLELLMVLQEIDTALGSGAFWMEPQRRTVGKWLMPGHAYVMPQPLGAVGIVTPWNYPILLSVGPLVCALAAGNRVMIKMPELVPRTSALFAELIGRHFAPDQVAVVNGDAEVGAMFSSLPFDHLLFTGSTRVGHAVMRAAADNLTPVTLELGGKSPVIIAPDITNNSRFDNAVDSLLVGKTANAGQTCIAPDYVLLPRGLEERFIARARHRVAQFYPDFINNRDFTSIVSEHHFARLHEMARQAQAGGAQLHPLLEVNPDDPALLALRRFVPTIITNAPDDSALMQEEIFGPLLPLVPCDSLDDMLGYINARPRPLAIYLYTENQPTIDRVTRETVSGGMTINETLLHSATTGLPFGGIGASGMGVYHGYDGFLTFSQVKPIFRQSRINGRNLLIPPYGRRFDWMIRLMTRW